METHAFSRWLQDAVFMGNTPLAYIYAIVAFAASLAILQLAKTFGISYLKAMAEATATDLDDLAVTLLEKFKRLEYFLAALFVATRYLYLSSAFSTALNLTLLFVFTYRGVTILLHFLSYWIQKLVSGHGLSADAKDSVTYGAQVILKTLVWAAAALFLLDKIGVNITALVAGLGIGGVAVALAAQAILGDLFNFFVILLDKPFKTGDFIVSEGINGTIEHVGVKSTRIRSISGELIIVSNSKLLSAGLRNYNHMQQRRVVFSLSVPYQTPPEKLRRVTGIVKAAIAAAATAKFDRSNLAACAASSLDFETVYYVTTGDYALYMATHEEILLKITEGFRAEGIDFAYPTRTVLVQQQNTAPQR